ncbi:MAG TPA: nuclear transport factor 2 family protein [Chryseosolibacter sp.]
MSKKEILVKANAAVVQGDNEKFLEFCNEDVVWNFVGERVLRGKQQVREYMRENYTEPPKFTVTNLIEEGDFLTALGTITTRDKNGREVRHMYCDVWRFKNDKMDELTAFVIESENT